MLTITGILELSTSRFSALAVYESMRSSELPAAISQGETEEEAILNVNEAIELVLEELEAHTQAQKPDKLELVTVTV